MINSSLPSCITESWILHERQFLESPRSAQLNVSVCLWLPHPPPSELYFPLGNWAEHRLCLRGIAPWQCLWNKFSIDSSPRFLQRHGPHRPWSVKQLKWIKLNYIKAAYHNRVQRILGVYNNCNSH